MPLKNRNRDSQVPEVNLVPMMDVLMTVLTFFIIISMTMSGQAILGIQLPEVESEDIEDVVAELPDETLIIGLTPTGELVLEDQTLSVEEVSDRVLAYLSESDERAVILKADRDLTYEDVAEILAALRDVGGDRIYLGIAD